MKEALKTFTLAKKNIYLDRKKRVASEEDIYTCDCFKADPKDVDRLHAEDPKASYNCGERCVNRYMCTECDPKQCQCVPHC
mmetsp:Transcript_14223/g.12111  ORF Transcript_14223/g.12111 Transcript_14223/m.12111 type:complete len:81 (+) Transcript_14223:44-286(+)